jgi:hypothetical protein
MDGFLIIGGGAVMIMLFCTIGIVIADKRAKQQDAKTV